MGKVSSELMLLTQRPFKCIRYLHCKWKYMFWVVSRYVFSLAMYCLWSSQLRKYASMIMTIHVYLLWRVIEAGWSVFWLRLIPVAILFAFDYHYTLWCSLTAWNLFYSFWVFASFFAHRISMKASQSKIKMMPIPTHIFFWMFESVVFIRFKKKYAFGSALSA